MPVYQLLGGKCREAARLLRARERRRDPRGDRERARHMAHGFRHVRVQVGVPGMAGYGSRGGGGGQGPGAAQRRRSSSPRPTCGARSSCWRLPQGTRRRGRAAARRPRARHAHAGGAVLQGRRALPAVLRRGPALAGGHRLVPPDPPAVHHAARDGRALQQPARVDAADLRAPDRLHPDPRLAGGRPHAVPQDRGARASSSACGPRGTARATFRRSATPATSRSTWPATTSASRSRSTFNERTREIFSGCPEIKDGYLYANEAPGWGIEVDEKRGGKVPVRPRRDRRARQAERRLGRDPAPGRHGDQAVGLRNF